MGDFKIRLKITSSAGISIDITGDALTYQVGSDTPVNIVSGTNIAIPWSPTLDMVTIEGTSVTLFNTNGSNKFSEAHLDKISATLIDLTSMFEYASGMTTFTCDANLSNVVSLNSTWKYCYNLQSMPYIDTYNVVDMSDTWYNCEKLISMPDKLDTHNVEYMSWTWHRCLILPAIPKVLDTGKVSIMSGAWYWCYALSEFPEVLDTSNVTNIRSAWHTCTSLTTFPRLSNTDSITHMGYTWGNCTGMTAMSPIKTTNVLNLGGTWSGCTNLKCLSKINTENATTTEDMLLDTHSLLRPNSAEIALLSQAGGYNYTLMGGCEPAYISTTFTGTDLVPVEHKRETFDIKI